MEQQRSKNGVKQGKLTSTEPMILSYSINFTRWLYRAAPVALHVATGSARWPSNTYVCVFVCVCVCLRACVCVCVFISTRSACASFNAFVCQCSSVCILCVCVCEYDCNIVQCAYAMLRIKHTHARPERKWISRDAFKLCGHCNHPDMDITPKKHAHLVTRFPAKKVHQHKS